MPTLEVGRGNAFLPKGFGPGVAFVTWLLLPFCNGVTGGAEEARCFSAGCFVPLRCLGRVVLVFVPCFLWQLSACTAHQPVSWRCPGASLV